jgi:hypothetical protein
MTMTETVPPEYPRLAAEAATRIATAADPMRAAILCSAQEVHAMALVAHVLLAPAFRGRRAGG